MDKQSWRGSASCASLTAREADELFFIGPGKSAKRARVFCASCPVKLECRNYAIVYNESGIWAGSTEEERKDMDPFIVDLLRSNEERVQGGLESRNLNDFIPQVRQQTPDFVIDLTDQEPTAEQLAVQDRLFESTNARQVS